METYVGVGLDKRQARRARRRNGLTPERLLRSVITTKYMTRAMKASMVRAERRAATLIERECSEGYCVELIDPKTGENTGGWGPVGCPCQNEEPSA